MATIYIGSARHDENGNITGGTAGDQTQTSSTNDTSGEVSMQTMYTHSKGWYIIRAKSVTHAEALAERMIAACNNAKIGYDQNQRTGIITYGIDTATACECDCSSLVRQCIIEATGTDPGNFTTANEATKLAATGLFEDKITYTSQSKTPVYDGDILVTQSKGHTVIVVSGNPRDNSTNAALTAGAKVELSKVSLYASSTTATASGAKTGTFYLWDAKALNGRVRITNKKANVGVASAITGWVNVSDLPTSSTTTTKTETATVDVAKSFSKSLAGTYKTTANLNMRTGAGTGKTILCVIPKGKTVQNYGYYNTLNGVKWLYCVYGDTLGYCCATYLSK